MSLAHRLTFASIFCFALAPLGALAADPAAHGAYTSTGYVEVAAQDPAQVEIEQGTQAKLLLNHRLLLSVLNSDDAIHQTGWFKQFTSSVAGEQRVDIAAAIKNLSENLHANVIPKSRLIEVTMSCDDPKDAQTIVHQIVDRHIKDQREILAAHQIDKAQALEQLKLNYESQVRDLRTRMLRILTDLGSFGSSVGAEPDSRQIELQQLISEWLKQAAAAARAKDALKTFNDAMQTNSAPAVDEAVWHDPICVERRRKVDEQRDMCDALSATAGPKDDKTVAAQAELAALERRLDDAQNEVRARAANVTRLKLQSDVSEAVSSQKFIEEKMTEVKSSLSMLAKMRSEYGRLQQNVDSVSAQLQKVIDEQDRLGFLERAGKTSPIDWASLPDLPEVKDAK